MISATYTFSKDIKMSFGIEKCAKVTLHRGKQQQTKDIPLSDKLAIQDLEAEALYKYLGVQEAGRMSHSKMKETIRKEFYRRTRAILKTELNSKNKMLALNSLAAPVVRYSFNIIN